MKFLTLILMASCLLAQTQSKNVKLLPRDQVASSMGGGGFGVPVSGDTLGIDGAALSVEEQANEPGYKKVWGLATKSGRYLAYGRLCYDNESIPLGGFQFETQPGQEFGAALLLDTERFSSAVPMLGPICDVSIYKLGGILYRTSVSIDPNMGQPEKVRVVSEDVVGDSYVITLNKLPPDSTITIGRYSVGEVRSTFSGNQIWFKTGWLPSRGPTTLTVCSRGSCSTTTYERKVQVGVDAINPGKG